jgi:hypothetical protein
MEENTDRREIPASPDQVVYRGLGTDITTHFLEGAATGAGGYLGVSGAKKVVGVVSKIFGNNDPPAAEVEWPPDVDRE